MNYRLLLYCCCLLFSGCSQNKNQQYIFIGHSYDWKAKDGNRVDPRIEQLDLSKYDQIWLGGDICARTSEDPATLSYLDELFGITKNNCHWALGNHDINKGNPALIEQKTGRPSFYSHYTDGLTFLVLNTNLGHPQLPAPDSSALCQQLNQQFSLLKKVCDTIQESAYLILLHHHALISNELADHQINVSDKWHYVWPALPFACTPTGSFEELAYPILTKVQQKGTQVVLIGGDIGQRSKGFEFQTKEGIWFLGSGINNSMDPRYVPEYVTNRNPDSILVFDYDLEKQKLEWTFEALGGD